MGIDLFQSVVIVLVNPCWFLPGILLFRLLIRRLFIGKQVLIIIFGIMHLFNRCSRALMIIEELAQRVGFRRHSSRGHARRDSHRRRLLESRIRPSLDTCKRPADFHHARRSLRRVGFVPFDDRRQVWVRRRRKRAHLGPHPMLLLMCFVLGRPAFSVFVRELKPGVSAAAAMGRVLGNREPLVMMRRATNGGGSDLHRGLDRLLLLLLLLL